MLSNNSPLSQSSQTDSIPAIQGALPSYFNLSINSEQSEQARRTLFELTSSSPPVIIAGQKNSCSIELSPQVHLGSYIIQPHTSAIAEKSGPPLPILLEYCGGFFPLEAPCIIRAGTSLIVDGVRFTLPNNFSLSNQTLREKFPSIVEFPQRTHLHGDESQLVDGRLTFGSYAALTDMGVSDLVQYQAHDGTRAWKFSGRENNEDSVGIDLHHDGRALLIVSDGMGGPPAGEIASFLVTSALLDLFQQDISPSQAYPLSRNHFHQYAVAAQNPQLLKMGAVAVSAEIAKDTATFHNLGDCRAYVVRPNESGASVIHKTIDHTPIQSEIAAGTISEAEAHAIYLANKADDRPRFFPKKFVCAAPDNGKEISDWVIPSETSCALEKGDLIILASDGLWGTVSAEDLCSLAAQHHDPRKLRDALHEEATKRTTTITQCRDNISIIVYRHGE